MIDVKEYPLKFIRKSDGKEFQGKRLGASHVSIVVDGVVEKHTVYKARIIYRSSKENKTLHNKLKRMRPRVHRTDGFEEYLNDGYKKLVS